MQDLEISTNQVPSRSPDIVSRELSGELLLVPIKKNASDVNEFYTLNNVGSYIWGQIDGQHTVEEIVTAVVNEFEVGPRQAKSDCLLLLKELHNIHVVSVS